MSYLTPLTPRQALRLYGNTLFEIEQKEITLYNKVYYFGGRIHRFKHQTVLISEPSLKFHVNDQIAYKYQVTEFLGSGSFGAVLKAFDHELVKWRAIKIIRTDDQYLQMIKQEIEILTKIKENDPYKMFCCIQYNTFFSHRGLLCITFPLMGQNLYQVLKSQNFVGFHINYVRFYATDLLYALVFLNKHGIMHCDLKPENILVNYWDNTKIKVLDFYIFI